MKTVKATFVFEHETVLGDLLDLIMEYSAKVSDIKYQGYDTELWELTLTFSDDYALTRFSQELGRNSI